ncbi:class I SAM-dependent methyltransferase [Aquibaculum arenosum]|uniref:Class I SAM-dependent methyltransferase n=1 Tax=Aquibaculum arenosum TaxID=3032591 RepID=A0ABT5YIC5_9PROT|nr:class I SAM-dependent methyltransferase [Fodinicurvata sp. CAU 1616]MDF2094678.1 class I SAM-dependent methyltransferase [Fodinicurvata sp. CAU 1616]
MATSKDHAPGLPRPSAWVCRFAPLIPPGGAVLDLACGSGRHLRLLRAMGHPVTGVDRDISPLADLAHLPDVEMIEADLENGSPFPLEGRRFDCVIVTNYLHRPLLPRLPDLLSSGGLLLYETFAQGNERFGRPSNPNFLLAPGELLEAVRQQLQVVAYEQGEVWEPKRAMVQRLAARKMEEAQG